MSALLKKIENRIRNFSDQKFEIGGLHVDLLDQSHFYKKFSERGGFKKLLTIEPPKSKPNFL